MWRDRTPPGALNLSPGGQGPGPPASPPSTGAQSAEISLPCSLESWGRRQTASARPHEPGCWPAPHEHSRVAGQLADVPPLLRAHMDPRLPRGTPSVRGPGCPPPPGELKDQCTGRGSARAPAGSCYALSRWVSGLRQPRAGPRPAAHLSGRRGFRRPLESSGGPQLPLVWDSQVWLFAALLPSASSVLKSEVRGHRQSKPMAPLCPRRGPSGVPLALELAPRGFLRGAALRKPVGHMTAESRARLGLSDPRLASRVLSPDFGKGTLSKGQ